jgi:UDP-N-acetylglucosamine:LPS N-acetylglucosamine transferase
LRVLILTASVGEGHDLPAQLLADQIRADRLDAEVRVVRGFSRPEFYEPRDPARCSHRRSESLNDS